MFLQSVLISTHIADVTTQEKCFYNPICRGFRRIGGTCYYTRTVEYVSACTSALCAVLNYRIHCCWKRGGGYYPTVDCWVYNPSESTILLLLRYNSCITGILLKCPLHVVYVWRLTFSTVLVLCRSQQTRPNHS